MKRSFPFWTAGMVFFADKTFRNPSESMQAKDIYNTPCFYPALNDYNTINTPMRFLLLLMPLYPFSVLQE